jgi:hypothetical protein
MKYALVLVGALMLGGFESVVTEVQRAQAQEEFHPRIAAAIRELEEAIKYLEAAPHNFGGHKADAIRDARAAVRQLRLAMAYRPR